MSVKSVFLPELRIDNDIIEIAGEEHHHLTVARAEPGEAVEVFDGKGHVWTARVQQMGKRRSLVRVENERQEPPPTMQLTLALALVRAAAFEFALEKAVEVGVTRIVPFMAQRSNTTAVRRNDRWRRIVVEAAKQSKHFHLPELAALQSFDEFLTIDATSRLLFAERRGGSLTAALSGPPVLYGIGPEGGWTDEELDRAGAAGFRLVSLGSGILRTETAAIVAAALIRHELGEL